MTRTDPELGLEKLCTVCGDWWPLDEEFWYFRVIPAGQPAKSGGKVYIRNVTVHHVYSRCRACWADRSASAHRARRATVGAV